VRYVVIPVLIRCGSLSETRCVVLTLETRERQRLSIYLSPHTHTHTRFRLDYSTHTYNTQVWDLTQFSKAHPGTSASLSIIPSLPSLHSQSFVFLFYFWYDFPYHRKIILNNNNNNKQAVRRSYYVVLVRIPLKRSKKHIPAISQIVFSQNHNAWAMWTHQPSLNLILQRLRMCIQKQRQRKTRKINQIFLKCLMCLILNR